jgi:NhaP-type Na+/H+ or K+/H+ antiporter
MGSELNAKERIFCAFAFLPKATVQAAIGAIPLAYGLAGGEIILAIAVLSILVSAPLGALLIRKTAPLLLNREQKKDSAS